MVESASMDASLVDLEIFVIPHARTIVMNRDALAKVNVTGASLDGLVYSVNVEVIVLNSDCVTKMEGVISVNSDILEKTAIRRVLKIVKDVVIEMKVHVINAFLVTMVNFVISYVLQIVTIIFVTKPTVLVLIVTQDGMGQNACVLDNVDLGSVIQMGLALRVLLGIMDYHAMTCVCQLVQGKAAYVKVDIV